MKWYLILFSTGETYELNLDEDLTRTNVLIWALENVIIADDLTDGFNLLTEEQMSCSTFTE